MAHCIHTGGLAKNKLIVSTKIRDRSILIEQRQVRKTQNNTKKATDCHTHTRHRHAQR